MPVEDKLQVDRSQHGAPDHRGGCSNLTAENFFLYDVSCFPFNVIFFIIGLVGRLEALTGRGKCHGSSVLSACVWMYGCLLVCIGWDGPHPTFLPFISTQLLVITHLFLVSWFGCQYLREWTLGKMCPVETSLSSYALGWASILTSINFLNCHVMESWWFPWYS